jgi:hypothetical protein
MVDPLNVELDEAVRLLVATFDAKSIDYALVGGLATALRGRPRYTQDVDVLLQVNQLALPPLLDELERVGFSLDQPTVIREFVYDHLTAFLYKSVRIDWLKPVLPLYANSLKRASILPWDARQNVRVVNTEGLILTKLVAFRSRDQSDIENLLSSNRDTIDLEMLRDDWAAVADTEDARTAWLEQAITVNCPPKK